MDILEGDISAQGWWARMLGELDLPGGFPINSDSQILETFRLVKAGAGTLFTLSGLNTKGSAQFVLLFDTTALPADGAVPVAAPITVPASSNFSVDFGQWGRAFSRGILVCNSSTSTTKTIGSADCWFAARYV